MYSARPVEVHFWLAIAGTLIYVFSMWNSGIIQGLMWRTYNESGTLAYSFVDSLVAMRPYYIARAIGGLLFLIGALVAAGDGRRSDQGRNCGNTRGNHSRHTPGRDVLCARPPEPDNCSEEADPQVVAKAVGRSHYRGREGDDFGDDPDALVEPVQVLA